MEKHSSILHKYLEAAQIQEQCTQLGDYQKGNIASKKLLKYNSYIDENFHKCKLIVDGLLDSDDLNTFLWVSNVAINHQYRTDYILFRLRAMATSRDIGVFRLNAEMQLQKAEKQLNVSEKI